MRWALWVAWAGIAILGYQVVKVSASMASRKFDARVVSGDLEKWVQFEPYSSVRFPMMYGEYERWHVIDANQDVPINARPAISAVARSSREGRGVFRESEWRDADGNPHWAPAIDEMDEGTVRSYDVLIPAAYGDAQQTVTVVPRTIYGPPIPPSKISIPATGIPAPVESSYEVEFGSKTLALRPLPIAIPGLRTTFKVELSHAVPGDRYAVELMDVDHKLTSTCSLDSSGKGFIAVDRRGYAQFAIRLLRLKAAEIELTARQSRGNKAISFADESGATVVHKREYARHPEVLDSNFINVEIGGLTVGPRLDARGNPFLDNPELFPNFKRIRSGWKGVARVNRIIGVERAGLRIKCPEDNPKLRWF